MIQGPNGGVTKAESLAGDVALLRLAELADELGAKHVASTARSIAERVSEGQFYVACIDQFKRGKSTLLNALIGEAVLATGVTPVTTVPTILRHGNSIAARVRFQGAEWKDIPVSAVEDYVSEEKNPENVKRVAGLEVFVPSPLLRSGMCLVDTPGLGSIFAENTAATHAFIPHIDAAVVVIGADPPLSGDELKLLETVAEHVHNLLFVLNKADRTGDAERASAMEFARNVLAKRLGRNIGAVYEVSALERQERRGPIRDWPLFVEALETISQRSGQALVGEAMERGIRRTSSQLRRVIEEERGALQRPLEESERRIERLRKSLAESEGAMRDLGVLLAAEGKRLAGILAERRNQFLKCTRENATKEFDLRLKSLTRRRNGPAFRREINHLAQDIARARLNPWLEGEATFVEEEFRKTAQRFSELGNDCIRRLRAAGVPGLEVLPEGIVADRQIRMGSHFHFHAIEREAFPASPLLLVSDLILGALGLRKWIIRDAREFLAELLEVNSSRVQSDVAERLAESRKELEAEIREVLQESSTTADRALSRARAAQAAGAPAVEAALARLDALGQEVISLSTRGPTN